jgi:hypothetical protein
LRWAPACELDHRHGATLHGMQGSGVQVPHLRQLRGAFDSWLVSDRPVSIGVVAPSATLGWEALRWFWTVVLPAIWRRPGGADGEAPAGNRATPGVPGLAVLGDLYGDAMIFRQAVGLEEVRIEDLQEVGSVSLGPSILVEYQPSIHSASQ